MRAKEQPIIIVRRKKIVGGHHGGAWKVAYADFVTAMMAFFLVMWLAAQDSRVRDAVAGYFQEPGLLPYQTSNSIIAMGTGAVDPGGTPTVNRRFNGQLEAEREELIRAASAIHAGLSNLPGFAELRNQIEYAVTTEGLRIELIDHNGSSFFDSGSSELRGESQKILAIIAQEVSAYVNDVVIEGHTDSRPFAGSGTRYTNWELSSDRANAARRVMLSGGLRPGQISAVRGFADTDLRVPDDSTDPRNRRVTIVVRSPSAREFERGLRERQTNGAPGASALSIPESTTPGGARRSVTSPSLMPPVSNSIPAGRSGPAAPPGGGTTPTP